MSEWISVNDRLPEKSGEYIVFTEKAHFMFLRYSKRHKAFNAYDWERKEVAESRAIKVAHWMPIPELPKGE